jgi:hypothetical protein
LTIGSEGYISFNAQAEKNLIDAAMSIANPRKMNATWTGGDELETLKSFGLWVVMDTAEFSHHVHEGAHGFLFLCPLCLVLTSLSRLPSRSRMGVVAPADSRKFYPPLSPLNYMLTRARI